MSVRTSAASIPRGSTGASLAIRFALREMRGGLRGFYVFIACIALGVMAIAGVGSVASGLADGLAREGRVILGGDLAFSLSLREASAAERAFIDARGRLSVAATMRAMARTPVTAARRWSRSRPSMPPIRSTERSALDPQQPLATLLAARDGVFGAAADPALLARLDLAPGARDHARRGGDRNPRHARLRARQARRRHRLRAAPAHQRGGFAGERAVAARQRGALALPVAPARQ